MWSSQQAAAMAAAFDLASRTLTKHARSAAACPRVLTLIELSPGRLFYSTLRLAARITLPHFSVSSAISLAKSAGEPVSTTPPASASRALNLGSESVALISLLSLSTISLGVVLGAPTPNQVLAS